MQEPDRDFTDLASRFGRAAAREIWKSLGKATRDLAKTIKALKLDADLCWMRLGVLHARSGQGEGASKRVRRAESGRASGTLAHGRGALPYDRHASAGGHRHLGQRTSKSGARVRRIPGGGRPPRRERFRAIARARRHGVTVADRSADSRRHDLSRAHRRGDWLCHAGISGAGRALQDEGHLRSRHKAVSAREGGG